MPENNKVTDESVVTDTAHKTADKPAPPTENRELDEYRAFVISAAESGEMIFNRTPAHASIIIECLLRKSTSRVDVLTGTLDPVVYGTGAVITAASEFLRRPNAKLTILHDGDVSATHPLPRALSALVGTDRFMVKRVPSQIAKSYPYHFAVGDEQHFRFEKQKEKCEAVAQFGNGRGGQALTREFEKLEAAVSLTV